MKRILSLILILALILSVACSKDNSNKTTKEEEAEIKEVMKKEEPKQVEEEKPKEEKKEVITGKVGELSGVYEGDISHLDFFNIEGDTLTMEFPNNIGYAMIGNHPYNYNYEGNENFEAYCGPSFPIKSKIIFDGYNFKIKFDGYDGEVDMKKVKNIAPQMSEYAESYAENPVFTEDGEGFTESEIKQYIDPFNRDKWKEEYTFDYQPPSESIESSEYDTWETKTPEKIPQPNSPLEGKYVSENHPSSTITWEFYNDGTFIANEYEGTYEVNGNMLTTKISHELNLFEDTNRFELIEEGFIFIDEELGNLRMIKQ